jgi:glycerol-3-phosphate acyltransferase PlsY
MERIYCLVIGYVLGLFQTAYIYGRMNGIDIREHGSGSAGTTNALRTLGTKAGLLVMLGDILKCMIAVHLCDYLFGRSNPEMLYLIKIYAGAGVILGHNFPFYLKFKGGKGIAATGGLILSFHPWFIIVGVVLFFGSFFTTHFVSVGSLLVNIGFLTQMLFMGEMGWFFSEMTAAHRYEMFGLTFALVALASVMHRGNVKRLMIGMERKTYLSKKKRADWEAAKPQRRAEALARLEAAEANKEKSIIAHIQAKLLAEELKLEAEAKAEAEAEKTKAF